MFSKYASNLLQNIHDECMLKSFSCTDDGLASIYRSISDKIDGLIRRIRVESSSQVSLIEHD